MTKIKCIFCEEYGERAKEHVWPRWLQDFIGGPTKGQHTGVHLSFPWPEPVSIRKQSGESLVCGNVCKKCNNGWMNELEIKTSPILKDVIKNKSRAKTWSFTEAEVISKWSFKTVIMINACSNYRKIIGKDLMRCFYKTLTLPRGVTVDIAFHKSEEKRLKWLQSQNFAIIAKEDVLNKLDHYKLTSFIVGMAIGDFVIRVVYWADENCKVNPSETNSLRRLFPFEGDVLFDNVPELDSIVSMGNCIIIYAQ